MSRDPADTMQGTSQGNLYRRGRRQTHLRGPTQTGLTYADTGGAGPVVVLLHGVLMNGSLWDEVVDGLRDEYRCIVPELPFGGHRVPMPDDADLALGSIAATIARFLAELDLHDVTLVCNDWGGAQLVVSPGGSDRVANLVLVSCEAFDNYPPGLPGRLLCTLAALPGGTFLSVQLLATSVDSTSSTGIRKHVEARDSERPLLELDSPCAPQQEGPSRLDEIP